MIRHTLNYYGDFCDAITVWDNESTDNTRDIIAKEFPHVKIVVWKSNQTINDQHYLNIKNYCWKQSTADWVIVADCDEFLYHPNLFIQLGEFKDDGITIPVVQGYNMFSEKFPDKYNESITDQVREGVPAAHFNKNIIFAPKYVKEINYQPGAHSCKPTGPKIVSSPSVFLKLLHYKYMSKDYVVAKHEAYASRLSSFNKENGYGAEYLKGDAFVEECFELLRKHKTKVI